MSWSVLFGSGVASSIAVFGVINFPLLVSNLQLLGPLLFACSNRCWNTMSLPSSSSVGFLQSVVWPTVVCDWALWIALHFPHLTVQQCFSDVAFVM